MNLKLASALLLITLGLSACGPATPTPVVPIVIPAPPEQPDFSLSLTSSVASVQVGNSVSVTVSVVRSGGFAGDLKLSLLNPPPGLSAAPVVVPAGVSSVQLVLSAAVGSVPGQVGLTLAADGADLHKTAAMTLMVSSAPVPVEQASLTLSSTPSSLTVQAGGAVNFSVNVARHKLSGPVKLHAVNLPAGVSVADITVASDQDSASLTLNTTSSSVAQVSNIQLEGVSGGSSAALNIPLTVQSAVVVPVPTPPTVVATTPASSAQNVASAGLSVDVTFSQQMQSDLGKAITFSPSVSSLVCNFQDDNAPQSRVLCSGDFKPDTSYTVTVGTGAKNISGIPLSQPYSFSFKTAVPGVVNPVPSLTLSATPESITVKPGVPATFAVKVVRTNLSGPVTLHLESLPANITAPDVTVPAEQDSASMTVTQTGKSNPFSGMVQLKASASGVNAFLNLSLTVQSVVNPLNVTSSSPGAGDQNVAYGMNSLEVKFSKAIQEVDNVAQTVTLTPALKNQHCFVKRDENNVPLNGLQCTGEFAPDTTYTVNLGTGIKAADGTPLAQPYTYSFKTLQTIILPPIFSDTTPPTVVDSNPADGKQGVSHAPLHIKVTFSEAMNQTSAQNAFQLSVPNFNSSKMSFNWNAAGTEMTLTYNEVLPYGTTVNWSMDNTSSDLAGNKLANSSFVGGSFRLVRQGTVKIYSDGVLDGSASSGGNVSLEPKYLRVTYAPKSTYERAFVSFNLQNQFKAPNFTAIESASLHVYQEDIFCGGGDSAYVNLGNVLAENVSYVLLNNALFSTFFNTAPISTGTTNVLSTNSSLGYKSMDVTQQLAYDVQNRAGLLEHSQWRLRFAQDSTSKWGHCGSTQWYGGGALLIFRPYLDVTYVYP